MAFNKPLSIARFRRNKVYISQFYMFSMQRFSPLSGLFGVVSRLWKAEAAWKKSRTQGDPLPPLPQDRPAATSTRQTVFSHIFHRPFQTLHLQSNIIIDNCLIFTGLRWNIKLWHCTSSATICWRWVSHAIFIATKPRNLHEAIEMEKKLANREPQRGRQTNESGVCSYAVWCKLANANPFHLYCTWASMGSTVIW